LGPVIIERLDVKQLGDAGFERYLTELEAGLQARKPGERFAFLTHIVSQDPLSSAQNRAVSEVLKRNGEQVKQTVSYALCTQSLLVRGAIRFIFMLSPPPFPYVVPARSLDAFAFFARAIPSLSAATLEAQYQGLIAG
jgi:hypothetical protein